MITVNGKKLALSKRKAGDVIALIEYCKTLDLPVDVILSEMSFEQLKNYSVVAAATVADSLKATYMNLGIEPSGIFAPLKKFFMKRKRKFYEPFAENGAGYLLTHCDPEVLGTAFNEVITLDEVKKNITPGAKREKEFPTELARA